jgi:hypothetical protein
MMDWNSQIQLEYNFTLPRGYVDKDGNVHRMGTMRLANALDEILPLSDPKVQKNAAYLTIILLTRVIVKLDGVPHMDTRVVESLFTVDLNYLQDFYQKINEQDAPSYACTCPDCGKHFEVPVNFMIAGTE